MESLSSVFNAMPQLKGVADKTEKPVESKEEREKRMKELTEKKCQFFNDSVGDLDKKDGYNCPLCKNKGGMLVVKDNGKTFYEAYRACKCMKIRSMIHKLERSGLKNVIKDYSFDKYETTEEWQKKLKEIAVAFTKDNANTWLFIGGMSGVGKTHLCTAVAAHYLRENKAVRYMLWRDEITKIKSVVNNSEEYGKVINELKTAEVLYIDDLFKMGKDANGNVQKPTVSDVNIAFEIINYRYNNKSLVTIISSERTIQDLIEIDEALGGRVSEMTVPQGYYIGVKYDKSKNYRTKGIIEL